MLDYNIHVFEKHALEYDRWFETHTYAYESEVLAIRSLLPRGGNGLEVGIGTGRFASQVGIKVGVEPAHAMASIARQRGIRVYETGAEGLPFADESFDSVLMVTAICFFSNPLQALWETRRVLKPLGQIVIGMIDKDSPLGKSYGAKKSKSTFYRYAHFYSVMQVINWLMQSGFGAIKTRQTIFKLPKDMTAIEPVKDGYGEGGFVIIAAQKEVKT
ncbi:MAG: class I SAM-dependent methyltransferase [Halobacteriota archaeon]